jgi:hypothetical protein
MAFALSRRLADERESSKAGCRCRVIKPRQRQLRTSPQDILNTYLAETIYVSIV